MLDVITIHSTDTPTGWFNRCARTIKEAAAAAPFPVNHIVVPGVPGNIGQAMHDGLGQSAGSYVAWVDDDDFVLPNAFTVLTDAMKREPNAVCARELQLHANGNVMPFAGRHHLTAWRRDLFARADLPSFPAFPLPHLFELAGDSMEDVMAWVYIRRIRVSGGANLRRTHARRSS